MESDRSSINDLQEKLQGLSPEDHESRLPILSSLGNLQFQSRDFKESIVSYKAAIKAAEKLKSEPRDIAVLEADLGAAQFEAGEFTESKLSYHKAARKEEDAADSDLAKLGKWYGSAAKAQFQFAHKMFDSKSFNESDYKAAVAFCKISIKHYQNARDIEKEVDNEMLSSVYANKGKSECLIADNSKTLADDQRSTMYESAADSHEWSIEFSNEEPQNDSDKQALAYKHDWAGYSRFRVTASGGNSAGYQDSIPHFQRAISLLEQTKNPDKHKLSDIHEFLGSAQFRLGEHRGDRDLMKDGAQSTKRSIALLLEDATNAPHKGRLAQLSQELGNQQLEIAQKMDDIQLLREAAGSFRSSVEYEKENQGKDPKKLGDRYESLGTTQIKIAQKTNEHSMHEKGCESLQSSIDSELSSETPDQEKIALRKGRLGVALLESRQDDVDREKLVRARQNLTQALSPEFQLEKHDCKMHREIDNIVNPNNPKQQDSLDRRILKKDLAAEDFPKWHDCLRGIDGTPQKFMIPNLEKKFTKGLYDATCDAESCRGFFAETSKLEKGEIKKIFTHLHTVGDAPRQQLFQTIIPHTAPSADPKEAEHLLKSMAQLPLKDLKNILSEQSKTSPAETAKAINEAASRTPQTAGQSSTFVRR